MPLREDAVLVTQRPYRTNLKIAHTIQEELKKLLDVRFIYEIKHSDCVSPIVCTKEERKTKSLCQLQKSQFMHGKGPLSFALHGDHSRKIGRTLGL